MTTTIGLVLYKTTNIYQLGEKIVGTLECFCKSPTRISAIKIILEGEAVTEWNESESFYDSNRKLQYANVTYSSTESYLHKEVILLQGDVNLPAGNHTYSFAFVLPNGGLPSSFEGSYGNIRYNIRAVLDRSMNTSLIHKLPIEISAPFDLNELPYLRNSATISTDKTMWSCFCRDNGILVFSISLPFTGYVNGQEVHVGAHVQNLTNVSVECVRFKIVQYLEFITRNPACKARHIENVITTRTEGGVGAHGEKSWTSILRIPKLKIYPNFDSCTIMNVHYRLKATAILTGLHSNLENEISLVIGGKSLEGVSNDFTSQMLPTVTSTLRAQDVMVEQPTPTISPEETSEYL